MLGGQVAGCTLDASPANGCFSGPLKVVAERHGLEALLYLGREKRADEQVAPELFPGTRFIALRGIPRIALALYIAQCLLRHGVQIDGRQCDLKHGVLIEQITLPPTAISGLKAFTNFFVVARQAFVSIGRDAIGHDRRVDYAYQAVAEHNMSIEESKRLARLNRLDPERHLAELNGERVYIHSVDAVLHNLTKRALSNTVVVDISVRVDTRNLCSEAAGSYQQKMT